MERRRPAADAAARAWGFAVAALVLAGGWFLSMPVADGLAPNGDPDSLWPARVGLLLGGTFALAGFAARNPGAVWAGVGCSALLVPFARWEWPFLPFGLALAGVAAWWQARQPRPPPVVPAPFLPVPVARVEVVQLPRREP